jgi:hypothetical protein
LGKHPQAVRLYNKHVNVSRHVHVGVPTCFLKKITLLYDLEDEDLLEEVDDFSDEPDFAKKVAKDAKLAVKVKTNPVEAAKQIEKFNKKWAATAKKNADAPPEVIQENEAGRGEVSSTAGNKKGKGKGSKKKGQNFFPSIITHF